VTDNPVTRTWTKTASGDVVRFEAVGALIVLGPDPETPGEWFVEVFEADGITAELSYIGGEASATRAGAFDIARRWRRALTNPAE
jgi:hypothetical protein